MAGNGEIFLDQVRQAQDLDMGVLTMPQYRAPRMPNEMANRVPWNTFKKRMAPLAILTSPDHPVEFLLCEKSVAWGVMDANIFAGQFGRTVHEITDLTDEEGQSFLDVNFILARQQITSGQGQASQINIGFNPDDLSIGHHSILQLHSHVRSTPNSVDLARRKRLTWQELEKFDRLAFIEPFAPLYHDYLVNQVENHSVLDTFRAGPAEKRLGYSSIPLQNGTDLAGIFPDLKRLYSGMRQEYAAVQSLYTNGTRDPQLDRYLPRPTDERQARVEAYLAATNVPYSDISLSALRYLAQHVTPAIARDPDNPRDMSARGKMYISRGFSGALTFRFEEDKAWLDILPRVVTTSGVTKTIMGDALPTVIAKTCSPAQAQEKAISKLYLQHLLAILHGALHPECAVTA